MRFEKFSFGSIRIDGVTHERDVVIDREGPQAQEKAVQEIPRSLRPHPLSVGEKIPWKCRRLVIGTGEGALPVMKEVKQEAARRKIKLFILPTADAIEVLRKASDETNAVLHVIARAIETEIATPCPWSASPRHVFHMPCVY